MKDPSLYGGDAYDCRLLFPEARQALEGAHAELKKSVTLMVREAVAASVAHALALPKQD